MRRLKYKVGSIVGNLEIIDEANGRRAPSGVIKRYWKVKCLLCSSIKEFNSQTIENAKSCGCLKYKRTSKPHNSGRKAPLGTDTAINIIISIYKSNSKKRGLLFNLSYKDTEELITSKCYYCGDSGDNVLKKKGYPDFIYSGIDRVNNKLGYEKENCVPCCRWCNEAKNSGSIQTFFDKCKKVSNNIEKEEKYFEIAKKRISDTIYEDNTSLNVRGKKCHNIG